VADVEKILRLVSEGALSPEEADEILRALDGATGEPSTQPPAAPAPPAPPPPPDPAGPRQLRIEVTEGGQRVVNLRVPMNVANWATAFLPGLSEDESSRIRGALDAGVRGAILDIGDDEGGRVLIVSE
jgi:hypothetical protein